MKKHLRYALEDINKPCVFEELKKEHLPLFIYGAGNLAENILKRLNEYNIKITGCFTDDGSGICEGFEVLSLKQLTKKFQNTKCNIVLGFAASYRNKNKLTKYNFNKIFEIDNPFNHHKSFDIQFIDKNYNLLNNIYRNLADNLSRNCLEAFINSRINKNSKYVIPYSKKDIDEFNNDICSTSPDEVFIDVGAYNGGSIQRFLNSNDNNYKSIVAIEPETNNFKNLLNLINKNNLKNIDAYQIGCWSKKTRLSFNKEDGKCCRYDEDSKQYIEVDTLDNIISCNTIPTLINIGISTGVVEIIKGARDLIQKKRPKLIIFMGASKEELYQIPNAIKSICEDYNIYLRFQSSIASRMFLYAIPNNLNCSYLENKSLSDHKLIDNLL